MNKPFLTRWSSTLAISAVLGCATEFVLPSVESGSLTIQTLNAVPSSLINYGGAGLEATLKNTTNQTLYANIGDGFNSAEEQDPLSTSSGSDAVVEGRGANDVWSPLIQGQMIEGTKYVALKPGKTYRLHSVIGAPSFRGQARIRVRYSNTPNATGTVAIDYSNVFEVQ